MSGAGISTSSGLPDFRNDTDGFWKKNTPVHFQEFLTSKSSRQKSWNNNIEIKKKLSNSNPSNMHKLINSVLKKSNKNFHITQNIDGLHFEAELESQILELHGNVNTASCLSCGDVYETEEFYGDVMLHGKDAVCQKCKIGFVKVNTISFGQSLNNNILENAKEAASNCEYFIVLGSSLKVSPANGLVTLAKNKGAKIVILNKESTQFDTMAELLINADLEEIYERIK